MTDGELIGELQNLGMDVSSYRALPLLPLVQVAWADGSIQDAEESLILDLSRDRYRLGEEGQRVLRNWLRYPPSRQYARRCHAILVALCDRSGFDALSHETLVDVLELAREVAKAAGGFFGFGAIEASEAEAIGEIARVLQIPTPRRWVGPEDETFFPADADEQSDGPSVAITIAQAPPVPPVLGTLVHFDPDRGDQTCLVGAQGVIIGRARESAVQIHYDAQVSRQHCRIEQRDQRLYVEDLDSLCGTLINGERVIERRLFGGERIQVGATTFFFQLS